MTHYPTHSRIYHIKVDSVDTPKLEPADKQHSMLNNKNKNVHVEPVLNKTSNSLSGLLAHYDSDSEHEHEEANGQEPNKLDAKVDDFLQEINKLTPADTKKKNVSCTWQECFDETTCYPYYWNVETNAVTWEMPEEYKLYLSRNVASENQVKAKVEPQKDSIVNKEPNKTLSEMTENKIKAMKVPTRRPTKSKPPSSDSEEEKIVMITSFSEDSSSESENENSSSLKQTNNSAATESLVVLGPHIEDIPKEVKDDSGIASNSSSSNKKEIIENVKEENIDETVILSRLRTQAKVLQELGGELPKSVDKSVIGMDVNNSDNIKSQSLSLVAGYGDDSDAEEEPLLKSLFPIPVEKELAPEQSQSTLFPVTEPVDVKKFELPSNSNKTPGFSVPKETEPESLVDNKVFKRKKRLGVAFDVLPKQEKKPRIDDLDYSVQERKGFGFQEDSTSDKPAFKKMEMGIAFVKADTLNPTEPVSKPEEASTENEEDPDDFEEMQNVVNEKVSFLGEGKPAVSAVQVMAIQLQTLEAAYKAGGLSRKYHYSWLRETFAELGKLEQEAAPEGWHCQWDRSNRRYFYRNLQTGETQWEYPESDIIGGGEAMDICTTPPPNEDADLVVPSPPAIKDDVPTPPPPPVITYTDNKQTAKPIDEIQPPIPSAPPPQEVTPPPPPTISVSESQPLPPGVDSPDLPYFASKQKESSNENESSVPKDSLGSELDSFYSDIALLEATVSSSTETTKSDTDNVPSPSSITENAPNSDVTVKKKKKSKSKLGQGINMKKKAVSTLVEKWKKVQNDYL